MSTDADVFHHTCSASGALIQTFICLIDVITQHNEELINI